MTKSSDEPTIAVPAGIEALLQFASENRSTRQKLLENPENMAQAAGIELTESEKKILGSISKDQLESMSLAVANPTEHKSRQKRLVKRPSRLKKSRLGGGMRIDEPREVIDLDQELDELLPEESQSTEQNPTPDSEPEQKKKVRRVRLVKPIRRKIGGCRSDSPRKVKVLAIKEIPDNKGSS